MTKVTNSTRRQLVARLKRQGFESQKFDTEKEADAFAEGLVAATVPWKTDVDYDVLPPVARKKPEWTVYFKVEVLDDDEEEY